MKKFFALFLLTIAYAAAQVETIDLGPHGQLNLYLLGDWKVAHASMAGQITLNLTPKNEELNATCKIEITFPDVDRFDTKQRLKLRVEADCKAYEEESVEGKAFGREFALSVPGAYGFYCNFTDANLRGRPSQPGNYKVVSAGKIRLNPNVLIDVFIGADGFRDEAYQQLLGAIEGMELRAGRRR